jgi:hypothetical protein
MSKYQKALRRIAFNYGLSALDGDTNEIMDDKFNEDMKVIKELVDKETPMRVTKNIECPVCGMYAQRVCRGVHTPAKRCVDEDCNQKLDWSVDDD